MSIKTAATEAVNAQLSGKPFYESKTLWINIIAIIGMFIQMRYGFALSSEIQTLALSLMNLILRAITKDSITW